MKRTSVRIANLQWLARHKPSVVTHSVINWTVAACDAGGLMIAGVAASRQALYVTLPQSLLLSLLAVYAFFLIPGNRRVYRWDEQRSMRREMFDVAVGLLLALPILMICVKVFQPSELLADWVVPWTVIALMGLAGERLAARAVVAYFRGRGDLQRCVAIIGAGAEGAQAVRTFRHRSGEERKYTIAGIFDDRVDRRAIAIDGMPVTHGVDKLLDVTREIEVDAVIVALPFQARERITQVLRTLSAVPTDILLPVETGWLNTKHATLRTVDDDTFLQVARRPLKGTRALLKIVEDYIVAVLGLLVVWPIMVAVAIAIRLEGPGPILFRQKRVGFSQKEFYVYKFRSMVVDQRDDGSYGTRWNDARVTKVGAFIRKYSLDELPQLFNVLRGEMSVVGPRAHVPQMRVGDRTYPETVAEYVARHRVKPGITGWAQINGMRGGIHDTEKARRGVELDLAYIENWSPWLDVQIMLRTLFGGMSGRDVF